MDKKILIFAGTTEGRELFEKISIMGITTDISVATEYGKTLLPDYVDKSHVLSGRLSSDDMKSLIQINGYNIVIDCTHPYAKEVTANIITACNQLDCTRLRLLRKQGDYYIGNCNKNVISCDNIQTAVSYLSSQEGNILSTIGSKELFSLTKIHDYQNRIYARVLPLSTVVQECEKMGFHGSHLICMQGPFSQELNVAMLKQYNCRFLLTKSSGISGGFQEKLSAVAECDGTIVIIERPTIEIGMSEREILEYLGNYFGIESPTQKETTKLINHKTHFPLFVNISQKTILVVGGGKVALRRINTLLQFDCNIKVVAPDIVPEIANFASTNKLNLEKRKFTPNDLDGIFVVISATDNENLNHGIAVLANERGIPISVASNSKDCSFFFPAIINTADTIIGLVGNGNNHKAVSEMSERLRNFTKEGRNI